MYEFVYDTLTDAQRDAYLDRIGWEGNCPLTREALNELVYLHQCHVPFENMDLYQGAQTVPLDAASLFDKVVTRRRGGFCFELNGSFLLLLRTLGFDAYACVCRVAATRLELGNLAHRAVLVRLDGKLYLCDVGLGGPMAPFAVEVSEQRQTVHGETYWVEPTEQGWYLKRRLNEQGEVGNVIIFAPLPFLAKDFEPLCQALTSSPTGHFRSRLMANLRRPDGYLNFAGTTLKVRDASGRHEEEFTEDQLPRMLEERFGLTWEIPKE